MFKIGIIYPLERTEKTEDVPFGSLLVHEFFDFDGTEFLKSNENQAVIKRTYGTHEFSPYQLVKVKMGRYEG